MGLDCYFVFDGIEDGEDEPQPERDLHLCGGMMSAHGSGSFRGKVYSKFVRDTTGHSLYSEKSSEELDEIAERLERTEWKEEFSDRYRSPNGVDELDDLTYMFRFYADQDARMVAWY